MSLDIPKLGEIPQSPLKTMKVIKTNKKSNLYSIEEQKNEDNSRKISDCNAQ